MLSKLLQCINPDSKYSKTSYAQSGEDMIVDFILSNLKIYLPYYLDIGAHHPSYLSNTYFFYKKGATGVCIEPDPELYAEMCKRRKKDLSIHAGIGGTGAREADFYIMSSRTLNTFSKIEAEHLCNYGSQKIEKICQIPLLPVSEILEKYLQRVPNFVSIDVEGFDQEIVQSFNLTEWRPEVFCIETITYSEDNTEQKENEIIEHMLKNEYMVYADTYINTIFVDRTKWRNR